MKLQKYPRLWTNVTTLVAHRVLGLDELLDFATPEERIQRVESFLDSLLQLNPKITQTEIFQKLRQHRAYIKKGSAILYHEPTFNLKPYMADAIVRDKWNIVNTI